MFAIGMQELIIALFIAFFIFGAKRLPGFGGGLGKAIRDFKKGLKDIHTEEEKIEEEVRLVRKEVEETEEATQGNSAPQEDKKSSGKEEPQETEKI